MFGDIKTTLCGRPLILYGAGTLGSKILDICRKHCIEVAYFCDRKSTGVFEGIDLIFPDKIRDKYPNAVVVVCSYTYNNEIYETLRKFGFPQEQIVPCPCKYPYFSSLRAFEAQIAGYEWAYGFFEDERSKQLVLDRIRLITRIVTPIMRMVL